MAIQYVCVNSRPKILLVQFLGRVVSLTKHGQVCMWLVYPIRQSIFEGDHLVFGEAGDAVGKSLTPYLGLTCTN